MISSKTKEKINLLIDKFPEVREGIINILLVAFGGRKATLIETANFESTIGILKGLEILRGVIHLLKEDNYSLVITKDILSLEEFPRFFITLNLIKSPISHSQIGKLLEMHCYNQSFHDQKKDRLRVSISAISTDSKNLFKKEVYVEMCIKNLTNQTKLENSLKQKMERYSNALKENEFPFQFIAEIEEWKGSKGK